MNGQEVTHSIAKTFLGYGLPTILYAVGILALSSIPDLTGPELPIVPFDKAAHVIEYGGFAILVMRSSGRYADRLSRSAQVVVSLGTVAVFAYLDELYQSTVPGRSSDPTDIADDILGAALGTILVLLWRRGR